MPRSFPVPPAFVLSLLAAAALPRATSAQVQGNKLDPLLRPLLNPAVVARIERTPRVAEVGPAQPHADVPAGGRVVLWMEFGVVRVAPAGVPRALAALAALPDILYYGGLGEIAGGAKLLPPGLAAYGVTQAILLGREHVRTLHAADTRVAMLEVRDRENTRLNAAGPWPSATRSTR